MLKKELRLNYLQLRKNISPEALSSASIAIANNVLKLAVWSYEYYHLFMQIPEQGEIDTSFILSVLQGKDKNVVIPKVINEQEMNHYLLTDSTIFKKNKWNIPEPTAGLEVPTNKIDVVFVPLLAFDIKGNRVGYGKGFYDLFLSKCKTDVIKVGLSLFEAEEKIMDIAENDVPLDFCVTPKKIYEF